MFSCQAWVLLICFTYSVCSVSCCLYYYYHICSDRYLLFHSGATSASLMESIDIMPTQRRRFFLFKASLTRIGFRKLATTHVRAARTRLRGGSIAPMHENKTKQTNQHNTQTKHIQYITTDDIQLIEQGSVAPMRIAPSTARARRRGGLRPPLAALGSLQHSCGFYFSVEITVTFF